MPLLNTDDAPVILTPGIQVLGPPAGEGRAGLIVRLGVRTTGCEDSAAAILVIAGTSTYWRRIKRAPGPRDRFAAIIGDPRVTVHEVGIGPPNAALTADNVFFSTFLDRQIKSFTVRRNALTTVVTGTAKGWGRRGESLVIELSVPWLARRNYSSCWLTLPPLTGFADIQEAIAAGLDPAGGDRPLDEALKPDERRVLGSRTTLLATTYIQTIGGTVDIGSSNPPPRSNGRTWSYSCQATRDPPHGAQLPHQLRRGNLPAGVPSNNGFSESTYTASPFTSADCAATAVVNDPGRGARRDLLVLLLGTGLGIAGTLLVEAALVVSRVHAR